MDELVNALVQRQEGIHISEVAALHLSIMKGINFSATGLFYRRA